MNALDQFQLARAVAIGETGGSVSLFVERTLGTQATAADIDREVNRAYDAMQFPEHTASVPAAELIRDIHAEIVKRATWWHCQTNDLHGINMAVNVAMIEVANAINIALAANAQSKAEVAA